jgi:hypothetical protein
VGISIRIEAETPSEYLYICLTNVAAVRIGKSIELILWAFCIRSAVGSREETENVQFYICLY